MGYLCCFTGCKKMPEFTCSCIKDFRYFCSSHLSIHTVSDLEATHEIKLCVKVIEKDKRKEFINKISESFSDNCLLIKTTVKRMKEAISVYMDTVKSLIRQNKLWKQVLNSVNINHNLFLPYDTAGQMDRKISNTQELKKIRCFLKKVTGFHKCLERLKKYGEDLGDNSESYLEFEQVSFIKSPMSSPRGSLKNLGVRFLGISKDLFAFKENSNTLASFNVISEVPNVMKVNGIEAQGYLSVICQVTGDKIFVYGGRNGGVCSSSAFLVDLNGLGARMLEPGLKRYAASGQVVGNKIYVFGGKNEECLSNSCYFDMRSEKWADIQNLPSCQGNTSTLYFDNIILICGDSSFICKYLLDKNAFMNLDVGVQTAPYNLIFQLNEKVFLLTERTYVSSVSQIETWTKIDTSNRGFNQTSCKPVVRKNCCYFITRKLEVLCFNCADYTMKKITKIQG